MATMREFIATTLDESAALTALGLADDGVFQADTVDDPGEMPFIVLRWAQADPGLGAVGKHGFEIWVYDNPGDYTRAEEIGKQAIRILAALDPERLDAGAVLMKVETTGPGLGQGRDLYDDAWGAVVLPFRAAAVYSAP